ncbi:MAG: hypothetical protein FJ100_22105, partial [Deltaproteobacteria bacterium]|nr:hypothetical protein [Deltaproteobacteria bacterium]
MDPKRLARPGFARLALVLLLASIGPQAAAASEFTIRKLTPASGGKLHLYHDHIAAPADAEVRVTVG